MCVPSFEPFHIMRFSLVGLLGAVMLCAVAIASLRFANELWACVVFTATVAALSFGCLALLCSIASRPLWIGFTLFGWGYLALAFGPWFGQNVGPFLLTTRLLNAVQSSLQTSIPVSVASPGSAGGGGAMMPGNSPGGSMPGGGGPGMGGPMLSGFGGGGTVLTGPSIETVYRIGHSWFAILAGMVGAALARAIRERDRRLS